MTKTDTFTEDEMKILRQIVNADEANNRLLRELHSLREQIVDKQRNFWFGVHDRLGLKQDRTQG